LRGLVSSTGSDNTCSSRTVELPEQAQRIFSASGAVLRDNTPSNALADLRNWIVGTDGITDRVGFYIEHLEVTIPASIVNRNLKLKHIEILDESTTGREDQQIGEIYNDEQLQQLLSDPFIILHAITLEKTP
jgi:hypothetical protein